MTGAEPSFAAKRRRNFGKELRWFGPRWTDSAAAAERAGWSHADSEVTSGYLSFWIDGLPDNADRGNVRVLIDGRNQEILKGPWPGEKGLRALVRPGIDELAVECGGTRSNSISIRTC